MVTFCYFFHSLNRKHTVPAMITLKERPAMIQRVLARFDMNITNFKTQGRPLYRSREDRINLPRENKATWFREGGATATIAIPCTPGSTLATQIRQVLQQHKGPVGTSIRVVERPGLKIVQELSKSNPNPRDNCSREDCPLALAGKRCREQCHSEGIVYLGECNICQEGEKAVYLGETSRTLYVRTQQHRADFLKARRVNDSGQEHLSWMWSHLQNSHHEQDNIDVTRDFSFSVLSRHRDPLSRQLEEAVRISNGLDRNIHTDNKGIEVKISCLNSKDEAFAPQIRWDRHRMT